MIPIVRQLSKKVVCNKALTSTEIKLDILQCTSCAVQTTYINIEKGESKDESGHKMGFEKEREEHVSSDEIP